MKSQSTYKRWLVEFLPALGIFGNSNYRVFHLIL